MRRVEAQAVIRRAQKAKQDVQNRLRFSRLDFGDGLEGDLAFVEKKLDLYLELEAAERLRREVWYMTTGDRRAKVMDAWKSPWHAELETFQSNRRRL